MSSRWITTFCGVVLCLGLDLGLGALAASAEVSSPLFAYEVQRLGVIGQRAISPSGQHFAWRAGDHIRLHDARSGEEIDLPGPPLAEGDSSPNLVLNDRYVTWRRTTLDRFELTELYLYDIERAELTQVYEPCSASDDPLLLDRFLVWRGLIPVDVPVGGGNFERHIFVYDARKAEIKDLTPDTNYVGWLTGDGSTIAWAQEAIPCCGHFTQVWAMDLRRGEKTMLDEGEESRYAVSVTGSTVQWTVSRSPASEQNVAFLRFQGCGSVGPELSIVVPFLAWGALRRRRHARVDCA